MIVNKPLVSSMRSRHTGHVGSSIKDGVGGANGFEESVGAWLGDVVRSLDGFDPREDVVGDFPTVIDMTSEEPTLAAWISTDFTNTT